MPPRNRFRFLTDARRLWDLFVPTEAVYCTLDRRSFRSRITDARRLGIAGDMGWGMGMESLVGVSIAPPPTSSWKDFFLWDNSVPALLPLGVVGAVGILPPV